MAKPPKHTLLGEFPDAYSTRDLELARHCPVIVRNGFATHHTKSIIAMRFACSRYWTMKPKLKTSVNVIKAASTFYRPLNEPFLSMLRETRRLFGTQYNHTPVLINIPYYVSIKGYPLAINIDVVTRASNNIYIQIYDFRSWATDEQFFRGWPLLLGAYLYIYFEQDRLKAFKNIIIRVQSAAMRQYIDMPHKDVNIKETVNTLHAYMEELYAQETRRTGKWCNDCEARSQCRSI